MTRNNHCYECDKEHGAGINKCPTLGKRLIEHLEEAKGMWVLGSDSDPFMETFDRPPYPGEVRKVMIENKWDMAWLHWATKDFSAQSPALYEFNFRGPSEKGRPDFDLLNLWNLDKRDRIYDSWHGRESIIGSGNLDELKEQVARLTPRNIGEQDG